MGEITVDEINRTIHILKSRVLCQRAILREMQGTKYAKDLMPEHLSLIEHVYRMTRIRDGLLVEKPVGLIH